jgi:hypothetical protein
MIFVLLALWCTAFGWYGSAAAAIFVGILTHYAASKHPPGDDDDY